MTANLITSEERAYFTMIPNMVDDMALSVFAFRLYCHIRRVAGEGGACWQSTSTLADACRFSAGKVSEAKKELVEAGLIQVETKTNKNFIYHHITIKDIWIANMAKYSVQEVNAKDIHHSPGEQYHSPHERHHSPGETKKNSLSRTNEEAVDSPFTTEASSPLMEEEATTATAISLPLMERWLTQFINDYEEHTKNIANEQLAEEATRATMSYITGKNYPMRYNFQWLEERYAGLLAKVESAPVSKYTPVN